MGCMLQAECVVMAKFLNFSILYQFEKTREGDCYHLVGVSSQCFTSNISKLIINLSRVNLIYVFQPLVLSYEIFRQ